MPDLPPKRQRFVEEYLTTLDAKAAASAAGYAERSAAVTGHRLLQTPVVAAAIQKAKAERSERTGIEADRVLLELARVAFSDMGKVAKWGRDGVTALDSEEIPVDVRLAVAEIASTDTKYGRTIRVKLHDKLRALELLGKHLGVFEGDEGDGGEQERLPIYWQRDPRTDLRVIDQPPARSNGAT